MTKTRASQTGPVTGLIAQVVLLAVLAGTAGLGAAGWTVGIACAVTMAAALARGLARAPGERLGPASWVTLARATLAVGVAALAADSFTHDTPVALLVTLAAVALVLDAVDGWVARRTGMATELGARFDGEVDAFLILALSVYVAPECGAWVLAIGAARYLFLAGEWLLPWMRAPLPPRRWRKLVAATQGVVLTVAAAGVLPRALTQALLLAALALLAASMGQCTWWLWRRRRRRPRAGSCAPASPWRSRCSPCCSSGPPSSRRTSRADLNLGAFARLPLELLVVVAVAALLPATPRRVLAVVLGAVLSVLVLVKVLDIGFFTAFDRPFRPLDDSSYLGIGIETLGDAIGTVEREPRRRRRGRAHRRAPRPPGPGAAARDAGRGRPPRLGAPGGGGAGRGLGGPPRRRRAGRLLERRRPGRRRGAGCADRPGRSRGVHPPDRPRPLRRHSRQPAADGPAGQGRPGRVRRELREGRGPGLVRLAPHRRRARAGRRTAAGRRLLLAQRLPHLADLRRPQLARAFHPAVGGHGQRRVAIRPGRQRSDRVTLTRAFKRAGWRAVGAMPGNRRAWPEGSTFYHYDAVYDRRNFGYRGPDFGLPPMPDQYTLLALQRRELAKRHRPPLFAEVDLISSHAPWTRIPQLIPWDDVGDGSIFDRLPAEESTQAALFGDAERARAAYGHSIEYSLRTHLLVRAALRRRQPRARRAGRPSARDARHRPRTPATTCPSRSSPTTPR